jgi:TnpA family transposase
MVSVKRTAYPSLKKQLNEEELTALYSLSQKELSLICQNANGNSQRLTFAVLLKTYQVLHYFPNLQSVPRQLKIFLSKQLGLANEIPLLAETNQKKTRSRYRKTIRKYLKRKPYKEEEIELLKTVITKAAYTMSDPADLINVSIEELVKEGTELPAFSTLDRLTNHLRTQVHEEIYHSVTKKLTPGQKSTLEKLLTVAPNEFISDFIRLKQTPNTPTLGHIRMWTERLEWIKKILDPNPFLQEVPFTKIRQFASEAQAYSIADMRGIAHEGKKFTLLLCLLHRSQMETIDALVDMFLRRMRRTENAAREELRLIQDKHRDWEESLISVLGEVLDHTTEEEDAIFGKQVRKILSDKGGVDTLKGIYEKVSAYHHNNYLSLLWPIHSKYRAVLFQLFDLIEIVSATQDQYLIQAFEFVKKYRHTHRKYLPLEIDLSFMSQRWFYFVQKRKKGKSFVDRRALEVCVFSYLEHSLLCGDIFVIGSEKYADYRAQLLPWADCEKKLEEYCGVVNLPTNSRDFVSQLKKRLARTIIEVDRSFPMNSEFTIDSNGIPHLKRQKAELPPEGLRTFEETVLSKMPERHLLDILKYTDVWTGYTKNFGPPSGSDPKLSDSIRRYLLTVFGYGCNLGPTQTARHVPSIINYHTLRRINAGHVSIVKLEAALTDVINEYARFEIPKFWGGGQAAIADGTHIELRENNLIGEQHIRYGGYGGIAYHHISDTYIALFSKFITCGVWEAVYIFDGLLQNKSDIHVDKVHADTQGQSEAVFGLSPFLAIKLMSRMRTWNDVTFYRPDPNFRCHHIDKLFTETVNWDLIETHWEDMMQVALSIQAGKVLPSMLLRKLGTRSRKNKLYLAFREVGRVERTLFLMQYISDPKFRREIQSETTKIESFNSFLDWISFGGPIVKDGDPEEQEKQLKYMNLVANAIMLSNVVDLTNVINQMIQEGKRVTPKLISKLSPYMRQHIRRFGQYTLDMDEKPEILKPTSIKFLGEKLK